MNCANSPRKGRACWMIWRRNARSSLKLKLQNWKSKPKSWRRKSRERQTMLEFYARCSLFEFRLLKLQINAAAVRTHAAGLAFRQEKPRVFHLAGLKNIIAHGL